MKRLFSVSDDSTVLKEYRMETSGELLNYIQEYVDSDTELQRVVISGNTIHRPLEVEGEKVVLYEPLNDKKQGSGRVYSPVISSDSCTSYVEKVSASKYMRIELPEELSSILKLLFSLGTDEPVERKKEEEKRKDIEKNHNILQGINFNFRTEEYTQLVYNLLDCVNAVDEKSYPLTKNTIALLTAKPFIGPEDEEDFIEAAKIGTYQLDILGLCKIKRENIASHISGRK